MQYFIYYLLTVNAIAFLFMLTDKRKARKHQWRIPEATLFMIALAFGSAGIWMGMYLLRHKTKHLKFVVGIPAVIVFQIAVVFYGYMNLQ